MSFWVSGFHVINNKSRSTGKSKRKADQEASKENAKVFDRAGIHDRKVGFFETRKTALQFQQKAPQTGENATRSTNVVNCVEKRRMVKRSARAKKSSRGPQRI